MSNNSVTAVDEQDYTPAEQVYRARYYAGHTTEGVDSSIYGDIVPVMQSIRALQAKNPGKPVANMWMFLLMNASAQSYSTQSIASSVQAQKYGQTLSNGFAKIDSALLAIQKLGAQGETDSATYADAAKALSDAYQQLSADLYGSYEDGNMMAGDKTPAYPGGIIADSANYFPVNIDGEQSSTFSDFNDIMDQAQTEFYVFGYPNPNAEPGSSVSPLLPSNNNMSLDSNYISFALMAAAIGNMDPLEQWCATAAEVSQGYVNGDYPNGDGYSPPDCLDLLFNGSVVLSGEYGPNGTSSGIQPLYQDAISDFNTQQASDIKSTQSILDQLYKAESSSVDNIVKEQITFVNNQKMA